MEEIDLKELFKMFWNKKIQIIIIIAIFIVLGAIYTLNFIKPVYTSYTTLVLTSSNNLPINEQQITANDVNLNSKLVETYSVLIKSKDIRRAVISNLNIDIDEKEFIKNIEVSSVKNTEVIKITVTNKNKYYAEKIANEVAKVFIEKVKEIYKIENIQVVDVAEVPEGPSNVHHIKDVVIFALIGIIVAGIYVFIINMLDTTVKSAEEIENIYKIPVLASIPICEEYIPKNKSKKGGKKG